MSSKDGLEWLFGEEGSVATETPVQVVMAAAGMAVCGIYLVSPIVSALAGPFAASEAAVGQFITAITAPSIVLIPVFGVLADRIGRRTVLVFGLLLFGGAGGAVAFAPSYEVALGLRLLQGVGYAAANPIGVVILGDLYGGNREATAQGLRVVGIQGIALAAPPIAGALVVLAWQYPFLLYFLAVPIAIVAWFTLPPTGGDADASIRAYVDNLGSTLSSPTLGPIVLSFVPRFALAVGLVAYVAVHVTQLGASPVVAGGVISLIGLVSLVGSTQAGRMTAGFDGTLVLAGGFACLAAGTVLIGIAGTFPLVVVGAIAAGLGRGLTGPVQKSLVTRLSPPSVRAGAVSSAIVFQSAGSAGGPFLIGLALAFVDVGTTFVIFGVALGTLGATLALVARRAGGDGTDRPA